MLMVGGSSVAKLSGMIYIITILPEIRHFFRADNLSHFLIPIFLFFGLLIFNNLININDLYFEVFNQSVFLNILIFWFLINHVRKDDLILEKAIISFALGSVLVTLFYNLGIGVGYMDDRLTIFEENSNAIGLKDSASMVIIILAVLQNRLKLGWYRYFLLIPVPFMLKLLAETGSRVAVITFTLSFITGVILFKTKNMWSKIVVFIGGALFLIFVGMQLMTSPVMIERLTKTSETGDLGGRENIWKTIIPLIKENPVWGVGNTGYDYFARAHLNLPYSPHNVILEVLCYTGIVGLIIYLTFLYQIFISGYRSYFKNGWLLQLLLIFSILGMVMSGQILYTKMGWMIFAYIVGSSAIRNDERENENRLSELGN